MQDNEMRLQHFLAKCGVASRRASEKFILDGRVSVNGEVIRTLGTKVERDDEIAVDGKKIAFEEHKRYVLLNKPAGYICSAYDERGRPLAVDLIKSNYTERLFNVGRLDMFSSGLIIFTNDGDFAARLSHPSAEIEKEYMVETNLPIPRDFVQRFTKGIRIENVFYRCKVAQEINSHKISITLIEGKNREIRRVFESMEIGIRHLKRIRIGNIAINGLKEAEFRDLVAQEVSGLLNLCRKK